MATLYKLTDQDGKTRAGQPGETQWGPGVRHEATGEPDQPLCTDGWIHAYESRLLAVLLNPIHANLADPKLWRCRGRIGKRDGQLKCGCRALTTVREIPVPQIIDKQHVRFGIACAWPTCEVPEWRTWARKWLTGEDRTAAAAAWTAATAAWTAWTAAAEADLDLIRIAEWAVTDQPIEALYPEVAK